MINNKPIDLKAIAKELRSIYKLDSKNAPKLIEAYLERVLSDLTWQERYEILKKIQSYFGSGQPLEKISTFDNTSAKEMINLILGKDLNLKDINDVQLRKRLFDAFNALFENINQILWVIDSTLLGKGRETVTIRHVIGSSLQDDGRSMEEYLKKIKVSFLVCHKAFQIAASNLINKILKELNPKNIEDEMSKGLKFGPLKKAEFYDRFVEKFIELENWVRSGKFLQELLREFENECQKMFLERGLSFDEK